MNEKKNSVAILVVDDNADDLELVKIALAALNCDVEIAEFMNGESALDMLRGSGTLPKLILLDLKLPGMSGIDTLREIRADAALRELPVFIVSSSVLETEKEAAISTGATGYLHKSFSIDDFIKDLGAVLNRWLPPECMPLKS